MKIKKVVHENAYGLFQARLDQAFITNQTFIEKPYWYENLETGQLYYDIYGCIGWPTEVTQKETDRPGYVCVIGVVKLKDETKNPKDAPFRLLGEAESFDIPTLIDNVLMLREEWGFGEHPEFLHTFLGDPERYVDILALRNEKLIKEKGERHSILLSPPLDFSTVNFFDEAYRSLYSVLEKDHVRLYFGQNNILRHRIMSFRLGEPSVIAAGGLMQWLLFGTPWLQSSKDTSMFIVEEKDVTN